MKNETLKNLAGIALIYAIILLGIFLVNVRMGEINSHPEVVSLER